MTHVSKQKLDPVQLAALMKQMYATLAKLSKASAPEFLDEFFGEEEKIMLAKRLGAIVMCIAGESTYRIWNVLKISPSTAERIRDRYRHGKYKNIEKLFKKNSLEYKRIVHVLELILNVGMSPRGKGRWKRVTKLLTQE